MSDSANGSTVQKGRAYEDRACRLLEADGCRILKRNFRLGHIDIDIIAVDSEGTVVFAEVKYRAKAIPQHPLQAVGAAKQRNLSKAASAYLYARGLSFDTPCRFDVIAFTGEDVTHIRGAFEMVCDF